MSPFHTSPELNGAKISRLQVSATHFEINRVCSAAIWIRLVILFAAQQQREHPTPNQSHALALTIVLCQGFRLSRANWNWSAIGLDTAK